MKGKTSGKAKLIILMLFVMVLLAIAIYARVVAKQISPVDEFYAIKGGNVNTANITFSINGTPSAPNAHITNITLWTNISGTWSANYTNTTVAAVGAVINRIFPHTDTSIFDFNLEDNLVFVWGAQVCDNKTNFINESVNIGTNAFGIVFDNKTGCTGVCNNTVVVKAGLGILSNFPVSSLDGVRNSTTSLSISGCKLNDSATGLFYCNQTKTIWNGTADNVDILIESNVLVDYTLVDTCVFSSNRTVFVHDAPNISITSPSDNQILNSSTVSINVTVKRGASQFGCDIYTNDTGSWAVEQGSFVAQNNTATISSKVITSPNVTLGVRCHESDNGNIFGWSDNITVAIDIDDPAITINSPADNSFFNVVSITNSSVTINLTVVENNEDSCTLRINGTDNATENYTSGISFDLSFNASDGVYLWDILCNDSIARTTETTNRTITIDSVIPTINRNINYSFIGTCKDFTVEFNSSEEVNLTFTYGTTSMAQTHRVVETDYARNQTVNLTFNETYETNFFTNATICDRAGNCNDTHTEMTIPSPVSLCEGWNLWSIYDTTINMSDLLIDTQSDFVYWWNNTPQEWVFVAPASTTRGSVNLGIGNMIHVFTSTNVTWFRNNSGTPAYDINVTEGHNYLPLYYGTSIGNLSYIQFRNSSGGNVTGPSFYGVGGLDFQIEFYDIYNNTGQEWHSSIFTWSRNNLTEVGGIRKEGLDTLHIFSDYNITANMTIGGQVFGNWSV